MRLYNYIKNKINDYLCGFPEVIICEGCGIEGILSFQEKHKTTTEEWASVGTSAKYPKQGHAWLCKVCLPNLKEHIPEKNRITAENIYKSLNAQNKL